MTNRFFIVVACRNAEKTLARAVQSVRDQRHRDWAMVIVDDQSTDGTGAIAEEFAARDSRIAAVKNTERKFALRNIVEAIWSRAPHDSIVLTVDGDDLLSDPDALSAVAAEYDRTGCDALWTRYQCLDGAPGISRPLMTGDPLTCPWTMSHLRTFRKPLIFALPPALYKNPRYGCWWRYTYDQLIFRSVLHCAKKHVFLDRVCYLYNVPAFEPDYVDLQRQNATDMEKILPAEFEKPRRIALIVNGRSAGSDPRFYYGERRAPLGILTMAAHLIARKHVVKIFDRHAEPGQPENLARAIQEFGANAAGVYVNTPNWADGKQILADLKQVKGLYVAAGGPHAILRPGEVLAAGAHSACTGEADFLISKIVREKPAGIVPGERLENLDAAPFPAFELLDPNKYETTWTYSGAAPVFQLASSRGCLGWCAFCQTRDLYGREFRAQSPERMLCDALHLMDYFGARGIYYREDHFGQNVDRVRAFCKLLIRSGRKLEWACEVRADRANSPGLLDLMAAAGCVGLYMGIEAATDRMLLDVFHKGLRAAKIRPAIAAAKRCGIKLALSFIEGHPLETRADVEAREKLISETRPETVHRCAFRPKGLNV